MHLGYQQGSYKTFSHIPTPYVANNDFNKFIHPKKLVDTGFTYLEEEEPLADFIKKHALYPRNKINIIGNMRPMQSKDISGVFKLFTNQQENANIKYKMS